MKEKSWLKEELFLDGDKGNLPWNDVEKDNIKAQIKASNDEILAQYPAEIMAAKIRARLEQTPGLEKKSTKTKVLRPNFLTMIPLAAVAALALFFAPWSSFTNQGELTERIKGQEPLLKVFKKTTSEPVILKDRTAVRPGDKLQFGYLAAGKPYGLIFSVDGRGVITQHFPEVGNQAGSLEKQEVLFPWSYELDDAPTYEKFFFVTADQSFTMENARGLLDDKWQPRSQTGSFLIKVLTLTKENP